MNKKAQLAAVRRIGAALLAGVLLAGALASCHPKNTESSEGSSSSGGDGNGGNPVKTNINGNEDPPVVTMNGRSDTVLLFELDQGIGGQELVGYFKGKPEQYQAALENIEAAIAPLKQKYPVAVLIFPQHEYKLEGWGAREGALDRFSPELLQAMDFFQSKGTAVYLELYTSGIYTNQNGELGTLTPPPLYASQPDRLIKGMSMDLDSVAALKDAYPDTFAGVKFHELIGTDELAEDGDPHGFLVEFDAIKAIADTCKAKNLELVWADHSWTLRDYKPGKAALWEEVVEYAAAQLGKQVSLTWANNNSGLWVALGQTPAVRELMERTDTSFGMSVQSWFWGAQSATPLLVSQHGAKWYRSNEDGTPIEILAAYTRYAVERGAHIVHFEPSWYFFNFHSSPWLVEQMKADPFADLDAGLRMMYEEKPDYSGRLALKRLIQILLDPENPQNPPADPAAYYGGTINQDHYFRNLSDDPYERFQQTTLTILNRDGYRQHYDFYNITEGWQREDKYRFSDALFAGTVVCAGRMNLRVDMHDELFVLKKTGEGKAVMEFYTQMSGLIGTEETLFNDNENGTVVSVTALNLRRELVNSLVNDTDELLVARQNGEGKITFEIYRVTNGLRPAYMDFNLKRLEGQQEAGILKDYGLDQGMAADAYIGVYGVRENYAMHSDTLLDYSSLLLLTNSGGQAHARYYRYGAVIEADLGGYDRETMLFTTGDVDSGYDDELLLLRREGTKGTVTAYRLSDTIQEAARYETDIHGEPAAFFSLKKGSYSNAASNLLSPDTKTEGENLAQGCEVATNGYPVGWGCAPRQAVDGDVKTWTQTADTSVLPELTIDLGAVKEVNRVAVYVAQWNYVKGYKISVSADGQTFEEVAAESNQIPAARFIHDFETKRARYVRLESTAIEGATATICEIQVFNAT